MLDSEILALRKLINPGLTFGSALKLFQLTYKQMKCLVKATALDGADVAIKLMRQHFSKTHNFYTSGISTAIGYQSLKLDFNFLLGKFHMYIALAFINATMLLSLCKFMHKLREQSSTDSKGLQIPNQWLLSLEVSSGSILDIPPRTYLAVTTESQWGSASSKDVSSSQGPANVTLFQCEASRSTCLCQNETLLSVLCEMDTVRSHNGITEFIQDSNTVRYGGRADYSIHPGAEQQQGKGYSERSFLLTLEVLEEDIPVIKWYKCAEIF
ncbi:hypothetical protein E5288_WYG012767 [Bos mutus]|uniref:Uncharacterized protein n=1 Tax=Bos mutus TaxID=72004 RepID=A0A6B0QWI3_9CETA|nr:hypothetical protein [Bos mutus]